MSLFPNGSASTTTGTLTLGTSSGTIGPGHAVSAGTLTGVLQGTSHGNYLWSGASNGISATVAPTPTVCLLCNRTNEEAQASGDLADMALPWFKLSGVPTSAPDNAYRISALPAVHVCGQCIDDALLRAYRAKVEAAEAEAKRAQEEFAAKMKAMQQQVYMHTHRTPTKIALPVSPPGRILMQNNNTYVSDGLHWVPLGDGGTAGTPVTWTVATDGDTGMYYDSTVGSAYQVSAEARRAAQAAQPTAPEESSGEESFGLQETLNALVGLTHGVGRP